MMHEYLIAYTYTYTPPPPRTSDRRSGRLVLYTETIGQALQDAHELLKDRRGEYEVVSVVRQDPEG